MNDLRESYRWMIKEDIKTLKSNNPNHTIIKARVLKGDVVSRNGRHYSETEIIKAVNTLIGKPINVNHDSKRIIGHIQNVDYEDHWVECLGLITNKTYAERARANDPNFKGWSVQADYYSNKCPRCKERFTTSEAFKKHMTEDEGIHNFTWEPHTIVFNGLAYVETPETPGVEGTRLDFAETHGGALQLLETVTSEEWTETKMTDTPNVKPQKTIIGGIGPPAESKEPQPPKTISETHTAKPSNEKPTEVPKPSLRLHEQEEPKTCPAGEHWDEKEGKCVPDAKKVEELKGITFKPLKIGEPCSPELRRCVDHLIADGKPEDSAWAICKAQLGETLSKFELTILESLSFEELRKNGLSEEACAQRLKETRILNENAQHIKETVDTLQANQTSLHENDVQLLEGVRQTQAELSRVFIEIQRTVNEYVKELQNGDNVINEAQLSHYKELTEKLTQMQDIIQSLPEDDLTWKEALTKLPADDLSWKEAIAKLPTDDLTWKDSLANLPKDDLTWKEHIEKHPIDDLSWKEHIEKHPADDLSWKDELKAANENFKAVNEKLTKALEEQDKTNKATIQEMKDNFGKLLDQADKNIMDARKTFDERVAKLQEDLGKKDTELKETKEKLAETVTDVDNLKDKQKGTFKGHSKPIQSSMPTVENPR